MARWSSRASCNSTSIGAASKATQAIVLMSINVLTPGSNGCRFRPRPNIQLFLLIKDLDHVRLGPRLTPNHTSRGSCPRQWCSSGGASRWRRALFIAP